MTGIARRTNRNQRDGVFNPMFQGAVAAALAAKLYRPGDQSIPRKAAIAAEASRWTRPSEMRAPSRAKRWSPGEDEQLRRPASDPALAARLDRTVPGVQMRRWHLRTADQGKG